MLCQTQDLLPGEPELEALLIEGVGLAVDALVVERLVARRLDALDLEGQPAAVACRVGEELRVVARGAEGSNVLAVLMEVGVCRPLVDRGHGDGGLQLVQLRGPHGVELLAAYQPVLCQRQQVVAPHAVGIGLRVEVGRQFRRQEMVEPGGLVGALFTYQHEDDVVDDRVVDPRGDHRHEPLPEVLVESHLLLHAALDLHRDRHLQDVVALAVPGRQVVEVVAERVVVGHEVRLYDVVDVLQPHRLLLRQPCPQGIHDAVGDRLPSRSGAGGVPVGAG